MLAALRLRGVTTARARLARRHLSEQPPQPKPKPTREQPEPEIWTDRFARLDARKVRRWAVGSAVPVLALPLGIALLPGLDETRRAVRFGLSYPADAVQLPGREVWNIGIGGVGLVGGFGAASGYIGKHAARLGPVFSAFRAPWACFGAVLGAQLCYQLAPAMLGHSIQIAKTAAFVLDGLEADLLGKGGQREWEREAELVEGRGEAFLIWSEGVWAASGGSEAGQPAAAAAGAAPAADAQPRPTQKGEASGAAQEVQDARHVAGRQDAEWHAAMRLCKRLTLLRKEEKEVKSDMAQLLKAGGDSATDDGIFGASGGPTSSARMEMSDRLLALAQQKQLVKDEAAAIGVRSLDAFAHGDLERSKVELSQARRRQVELARKLKATRHIRGDNADRRAWNRELHALEARKAELKARAKNAHGNATLGREARTCTRWQEVLSGKKSS